LAPAYKREQHVAQGLALGGKRVGVAHRALLVGRADDDSGSFQTLEALREDVGRNMFRRVRELAVRALAVQQIAQKAWWCSFQPVLRCRMTSDLHYASNGASVATHLQNASL